MEAQPPKRAELPKRSRQVAGEPSHPGYAVTVPPLPTRESKGSWSVIVSPPCATMNRKSPPAAAYPRVKYPFGYAAKDGDASRYPSTDMLDGTIEQRLREAFTVAGYIFFQNCEQAQRQKIFLYSSIPDEQVRPMGMRSFSDMTELLKEAKEEHQKRLKGGKYECPIPKGVKPRIISAKK